MKTEKELVADNLKRYRDYRNLTQEQLAEASGVDLRQIVALENGDLEQPIIGDLLTLSRFFGLTLYDMSSEQRKLSSVRFRANKSVTPVKRSELVENCARWLENYCDLEEWLNQQTVFDASLFGNVQNGDVPAFAANVREKLSLNPSETISNLGDVLQRSCVKYWFCDDFGSIPFFGLAIAESPQATAVVVNNKTQSVERRIFSTVHEFAHLLLHSESFNGDVWEEDEIEEDEANLFASHFLMPNDVFKKYWSETFGEPFVARVLSVKRYFRVSYMTVLKRLAENSGKSFDGYIAGFRAAYAKAYGKRLTKNAEPAPLLSFDAPPDRFRSLVYEAVIQGEISFRRAAEMLGMSYLDFYYSPRTELLHEDDLKCMREWTDKELDKACEEATA